LEFACRIGTMKDFIDKVAVVTGAASGIGRGLAGRCAKEGMKVVLADVEETALNQAEKELGGKRSDVLAVKTDVSRYKDVESLAQQTLDKFGAVHLLFNNAGVQTGMPSNTPVWDSTLSDWEWLIGVNLMGVVHGIKAFLSIMLKQQTECHVVNTSSIAGLIAEPELVVYGVTKAGVIKISEALYLQLQKIKAPIGVSVLCPAFVNSRLNDAERNRPEGLQNPPGTPRQAAQPTLVKQAREDKRPLTPEQYADVVFKAIRDNIFYVLNDPSINPIIKQRIDNILEGRSPTKSYQG
jgi:NAD(P)-dependent dehydrogenase (short-subunit alcohol dehydrogenase family)